MDLVDLAAYYMIADSFHNKDRETSALRALRLLDPQEICKHQPEDILKVYFEAESLLLQDNPEWDLPRVVESALIVSLHRLGAMNQYDPVLLKRAREDVLQLGLYPDVKKTLDDLCSQGITVVGLRVPDASLFVLSPSRVVHLRLLLPGQSCAFKDILGSVCHLVRASSVHSGRLEWEGTSSRYHYWSIQGTRACP